MSQTPQVVLQHWEDQGSLRLGSRYTYAGEGLLEVTGVRERGDFRDVDWRETVSGHRSSVAVRSSRRKDGEV